MIQASKVALGAFLLVGATGGYALRMAHADGIPDANTLLYAGTLEDSEGVPLTGVHDIAVAVHGAASGGTPLCSGSVKGQRVFHGHFEVGLPQNCVGAIQASKNVHIEVTVDGKTLPRSKAGAVPYAVEAGHAQEASQADTATSASNAAGALLGTLDQLSSTLAGAAQKKDLPALQGWMKFVPGLSCDGAPVVGANPQGRWRRVGDSAEIIVGTDFSQQPGLCAGLWRWTLPAGLVADLTKASDSVCGPASIHTNGTFTMCRTVITNQGNLLLQCQGAGSLRQEGSGVYSFGVGTGIELHAVVPIKGWTATSP
ncbi:MAG: hypothetical protein MUF64_03270 [Polyangiaceae bacterium]|jgi:hypothetical protein|nr:hypothetical protein [Polyangiaceae bacterium]